MDRIIYKCKKCSWETSITAAWSDLKPRNCGRKKCKTSFRLHPELLSTILPVKIEEVVQTQSKLKVDKKVLNKKDEQTEA